MLQSVPYGCAYSQISNSHYSLRIVDSRLYILGCRMLSIASNDIRFQGFCNNQEDQLFKLLDRLQEGTTTESDKAFIAAAESRDCEDWLEDLKSAMDDLAGH